MQNLKKKNTVPFLYKLFFWRAKMIIFGQSCPKDSILTPTKTLFMKMQFGTIPGKRRKYHLLFMFYGTLPLTSFYYLDLPVPVLSSRTC